MKRIVFSNTKSGANGGRIASEVCSYIFSVLALKNGEEGECEMGGREIGLKEYCKRIDCSIA